MEKKELPDYDTIKDRKVWSNDACPSKISVSVDLRKQQVFRWGVWWRRDEEQAPKSGPPGDDFHPWSQGFSMDDGIKLGTVAFGQLADEKTQEKTFQAAPEKGDANKGAKKNGPAFRLIDEWGQDQPSYTFSIYTPHDNNTLYFRRLAPQTLQPSVQRLFAELGLDPLPIPKVDNSTKGK